MQVSSALGNIFSQVRYSAKFKKSKVGGYCEILHLTRQEMERFRIRRTTDKGSDIQIVRDADLPLKNGDVLVDSHDRLVVIEQLPELVISVAILVKDIKKVIEVSAALAHYVGNRHRPLSVIDRVISFPALGRGELELFKHVTAPIRKSIRVTLAETAFEPTNLDQVHEHA